MGNSKKNKIIKKGTVLEALPSLTFRVLLENGREIIAYLAGRLRIYKIKILPGDSVQIEMNSEEEQRGRIVYRGK